MKVISFIGGFIFAFASLLALSFKGVFAFIKNPELKTVFKFANFFYKSTFLILIANLMYSFSNNDKSWSYILNFLLILFVVISMFTTIKPVSKKIHDKFLTLNGIDANTINHIVDSLSETPPPVLNKIHSTLEKRVKEDNTAIPKFKNLPMAFYIGFYESSKNKKS